MIRRPCLDCGTLHSNQSRCSSHQSARGKSKGRPHNHPTYRRNRKRLITDHIRRFGYVCPGAEDLHHEAHPCTDLTADHIIQVAHGGSHALHNLRVLCESQNKARNGRT